MQNIHTKMNFSFLLFVDSRRFSRFIIFILRLKIAFFITVSVKFLYYRLLARLFGMELKM